MRRLIRRLCTIGAVLGLVGAHAETLGNVTPTERLQADYPALHRLRIEYAAYEENFISYGKKQGFLNPYESLGTAVHELVHLASAKHYGFFIDGVYYEPYVEPAAWPSLHNEDVIPEIATAERGRIYWNYLRNTPRNNLGNILDEVNAYTHVLKFICMNEPQSCRRQADNLIGHLQVVEVYLRLTRTKRPGEYAALAKNRQSLGAIRTITGRAWDALLACGLPGVQLPRQEAAYLVGLAK